MQVIIESEIMQIPKTAPLFLSNLFKDDNQNDEDVFCTDCKIQI